jgi:UDP-galactopyranose mutase
MSRFAKERRVFFVEEPQPHDGTPRLASRVCSKTGVHIVVPQMPTGLPLDEQEAIIEKLLVEYFADQNITNYMFWYYTPMALGFTKAFEPVISIFDCMDELSAFKNAPALLRQREADLFGEVDLVFTGGMSLYEAKLGKHPSVHAFPSGVDVDHFRQARQNLPDPADQASIPHPRVGYCGVIDERIDLELIRELAAMRQDLQFVLIGPIVKIDPAAVPSGPNIHHLGGKDYAELPSYFSSWDVAILPFARNDSTRYISPTKTPEYLAAGKPAVSTSITDVIRPYKELRLVEIADRASDFSDAIDRCLKQRNDRGWLGMADDFLQTKSWDAVWGAMNALMDEAIQKNSATSSAKAASTVAAASQSTIQTDKGVQECSIS